MSNKISLYQEKFPLQKIVVIGDLVADQFLHGTIARVSREAPVLILRHDETETLAGGAANAAVNVASLGGNAVVIGVVGQDSNGEALLETLKLSGVNCDFVVFDKAFQTTTKVRVLAGQDFAPRQQVIRIDYEHRRTIENDLQIKLNEHLIAASENADAIIISDYNYGMANSQIYDLAVKISAQKNIPLLVDSRFSLQNFQNVTAATPNLEEVEQILGKNFTENDCVRLCENLGYQCLLITKGNKGMMLVEKGKSPVQFEAVGSKEPIDVTGAGDTVIATFALSLASGLSFAESAILANHAGGIVVMKKGTASVSLDELLISLTENSKSVFKTQKLL